MSDINASAPLLPELLFGAQDIRRHRRDAAHAHCVKTTFACRQWSDTLMPHGINLAVQVQTAPNGIQIMHKSYRWCLHRQILLCKLSKVERS